MIQNREARRVVFDRIARLYDEVRPDYPETLIDDVVRLSGIPETGRILEIGCGTGKATMPFARRGYAIVCLDIGENLAAMTAEKCLPYPDVQVCVESFESWDPAGQTFDLVISAQAFHWIDPAVGFGKIASVLKDTGTFAKIGNDHTSKNEGFYAETDDVYVACAPSIARKIKSQQASSETPETPPEDPMIASGLFEKLPQKRYPWTATYDADTYIKLLSTYSDHINLKDEERTCLFEGLRTLINERYDGQVVKHYEGVLDMGIKLAG